MTGGGGQHRRRRDRAAAATTGGGATSGRRQRRNLHRRPRSTTAQHRRPAIHGQPPAAQRGQRRLIAATTLGRGPQSPAAGIVRLRDVGRVEMGARTTSRPPPSTASRAVGLAVFQLPGTNALDVADRVQAKMKELQDALPRRHRLQHRLRHHAVHPRVGDRRGPDAVRGRRSWSALVVLAFLQNWRSVLIPMIAVPVAIVGTFAVMAAVGFSLNNISLFGLVLAIGIVVDDAIVVVENVERWLEQGLPPREATYKAMEEVTGPVIAVALVLCAVFVPCAFISGITGRFFRQFAVTIAASTVFSAINSLTLSPALAAILLRPRHGGRRDPLDLAAGRRRWAGSSGCSTRVFGASTTGYAWIVGRLLRVNVRGACSSTGSCCC